MKRISTEEKQRIINSYKSGESVICISKRTEIPQSTIYGWIKAEQLVPVDLPINKTTINNLARTGEKQRSMIEVLQRAFNVESIPIQIRLHMLEELYSDYSVHALCDALMVPRGTFYNHILRNKRDNTCFITANVPTPRTNTRLRTEKKLSITASKTKTMSNNSETQGSDSKVFSV